jgi:lipopolysaccharide export system permease protein
LQKYKGLFLFTKEIPLVSISPMRIVSHYIAKEFLKMTLICLGTFVTIYLLVEIMEKLDDFSTAGVPSHQMVNYFIYIIPAIIKQMIPVAILMGTQLTFGSFSKNNQLIAFKSSGISMIRLSSPIILLAIVTSLLVFILGESLIPATNARAMEIWNVQVKKMESRAVLINQRVWYKGDRSIYTFDRFNFKEQSADKVSLYFFDPQFRLQSRLDAERGIWADGVWTFEDGLYQTFQPTSSDSSQLFKVLKLPLAETPEDFRYREKSSEEMTYSELRQFIGKVEREGYEAQSYRVEQQMRLSFPGVSMIMALIGISMALRREKGIGIAQGIVGSLAVTFVYWIFFGFSRSLGLSGVFPAFWAAWASNILFLLIGGYLLLHIRQ